MTTGAQTKKVGLALGGGGAKGLAHIGVIKELEKAGIEISYISGTSMGALVGGFYAATKDIQFLEDFFLSIQSEDVYSTVHMMRKKDGQMLKGDLLSRIEEKIKNIDVSETKIPFAAIATDVETGDELVLSKGSLVEAIRASTALPMVFPPVRLDERVLMDGGFVNPVPADVVRNMGAEFVIAVDVSSKWVNLEHESLSPARFYSIIPHALSVIEYQLARTILKQADVVLTPAVLDFHWNSFPQGKTIIELGVKEIKSKMREIYKGIGIQPPEKKPFEKFADLIFYGIDE